MTTDYSVLMSVYIKEKPDNLRTAIESMMEQTIPPSDFVLVCDGPLSEEHYSVISDLEKKYPVLSRIQRESSKGLGNALNYGLGYCKNDIVARMDSDDVAVPDRMERQLRAFGEKGADIVSGTVEEFLKEPGDMGVFRTLPETDEQILEFSKRRNPFNHPCVAFRKQRVYMVGGYIETKWFEDYYLWLRMLDSGCIGYNIPETLLHMRSGKDMYKRRGGLKYAAAAAKFRKRMYAEGYCGLYDYFVAAAAHTVSAAVPWRLRMLLYSKNLRKKAKD